MVPFGWWTVEGEEKAGKEKIVEKSRLIRSFASFLLLFLLFFFFFLPGKRELCWKALVHFRKVGDGLAKKLAREMVLRQGSETYIWHARGPGICVK